MEYKFDWNKAFKEAKEGKRKLIDEHIKEVYQTILIPFISQKTFSKEKAEPIASYVIEVFWERFYYKEEPIPQNVNGYIYRMAMNATIKHSQFEKMKSKKEILLENNDIEYAFRNVNPKDNNFAEPTLAEEKEATLIALENSLGQLGEKCQILLKKFIFEKQKMKNIAQEMGFPTPNSATKKKENCINKLRKLLYNELYNQKYNNHA